MLATKIIASRQRADRLVDTFRLKQATGVGPAAFNPVASLFQPAGIGNATEQYRHNRGWVAACVRLVSQRIAAQPIHVAYTASQTMGNGFRLKSQTDNLEPLESHPLLDVLHDPSPLLTASQLIAITVANIELTGRALWYCTEDETGKPSILPIPTSWIQSVDVGRTIWTIRPPHSAGTIDLPGDRVMHIAYVDPADPWGCISPLSQISEAVAADEGILESQWRVFKQGMLPGLVLTAGRLPDASGAPNGPRPELTPEQRTQLINSIRAAYSGVTRWGEPLILDGLIERVEKLSLTPKELDFLNSSKVTKARILQGFGVSPILLGEVEGANRASATVADEIFCANKVNPLISLLSQAMTEWLGPMFAAPGEKLAVWIEPAVPHDPELDLQKWNFAAGQGIVDADEYRRHILKLQDRPKAITDDPAAVADPVAATPAGPAQADVQATALNGAQVDSLLSIAQMVASGELPPDAARALIAAAFPLLSAEQVDGIVNPIKPAASPAAMALAKHLNPYTLRPLNGNA